MSERNDAIGLPIRVAAPEWASHEAKQHAESPPPPPNASPEPTDDNQVDGGARPDVLMPMHLRRCASPPPHSRVRDDLTPQQARDMMRAKLPAGAFKDLDAILQLDFSHASGITDTLLGMADDSDFLFALNDDAIVDKHKQVHHLMSLAQSLFRNDAPTRLARQIRALSLRDRGSDEAVAPQPLADKATLGMLPPKIQDVLTSIDRARDLLQKPVSCAFAFSCVAEAESFTGVTDITNRRCDPSVHGIVDGLVDSLRGPFDDLPDRRSDDTKTLLFKIAHGYLTTVTALKAKVGGRAKVVEIRPNARAATTDDANSPENAVMIAYRESFEAMLLRGNVLSWVSTHLCCGTLLFLDELSPADRKTFKELSPRLVDVTFRRLAAAFPCLRDLGLFLSDAVLLPVIDGQKQTDSRVCELANAGRAGSLAWRKLYRTVGLI